MTQYGLSDTTTKLKRNHIISQLRKLGIYEQEGKALDLLDYKSLKYLLARERAVRL